MYKDEIELISIFLSFYSYSFIYYLSYLTSYETWHSMTFVLALFDNFYGTCPGILALCGTSFGTLAPITGTLRLSLEPWQSVRHALATRHVLELTLQFWHFLALSMVLSGTL